MVRSLWGVDSAVKVDEKLYQCVLKNYGKPKYWGRYLTGKEGVNDGLSREEILFLHMRGIRILPIYNDFTEALGYRKGQVTARNAIFHANRLNFPKDSVLFANVENFFSVDDAWIRGWIDVFYNSGYRPGFYHDPTEGNFQQAFCTASKKNEKVSKQALLWSAEPEMEVTSLKEAPLFQPKKLSCTANVWGWQYGRDAEDCAIDTNLITFNLYQFLW
jgi:hypothetical protein